MDKIRKWYQGHISENPSSSRWGIFSFLVSISLFLLALSPSFYSIYLSILGGAVMLPNWVMYLSFVLFALTGIVGIIVAILAVVKALQWLNDPRRDETLHTIQKIEKGVGDVKKKLGIDD
jgi:membrane protein implicated in regulation of membrane protease activity